MSGGSDRTTVTVEGAKGELSVDRRKSGQVSLIRDTRGATRGAASILGRHGELRDTVGRVVSRGLLAADNGESVITDLISDSGASPARASLGGRRSAHRVRHHPQSDR